jgi:hypothetical protein
MIGAANFGDQFVDVKLRVSKEMLTVFSSSFTNLFFSAGWYTLLNLEQRFMER